MKVGVTLPSFRHDAAETLAAARRAEELGIDGVFVFDHLWPMGQPGRPALAALPLLGAVAATTERITLGPLVARVGMLPDRVLVAALVSLETMAPGRFIAGIGTGDTKSADENEALGIPFVGADDRRLAVARCARELLVQDIPVWIGGGARATTELAGKLGAVVNLWDVDREALAAQAGRTEVTWGGPVPGDAAAVASQLRWLRDAGASWAVCAWPESLEAVAEAAATLD